MSIQQELNLISARRGNLSSLGVNMEDLPKNFKCVDCVNLIQANRNGVLLPDSDLGGGTTMLALKQNFTEINSLGKLQTGDIASWSSPYIHAEMNGANRMAFDAYRHVGIYNNGYIFSKLGPTAPYANLSFDEIAAYYGQYLLQFWHP